MEFAPPNAEKEVKHQEDDLRWHQFFGRLRTCCRVQKGARSSSSRTEEVAATAETAEREEREEKEGTL
ncbi:uncharacterized protein ASCRUDRAFT_75583 [Ascoidea rubescens DSM 1968]|uniref:Uncharacterized protein n=1 Tax=Ascoidea rubescens DSM 1968 TaxID=1344418 RepID=A0A1D2VIY9_9ASCO|nr:hypothetical protein ASCRUDRAFT_75583 [Ascoidea rubescens DSM 1968]ODV61591.1 hypothetical protein ASCRUDRAFT_75583 [Ascoidea rubescens DSM 1968]